MLNVFLQGAFQAWSIIFLNLLHDACFPGFLFTPPKKDSKTHLVLFLG